MNAEYEYDDWEAENAEWVWVPVENKRAPGWAWKGLALGAVLLIGVCVALTLAVR
ncbi:MAG TPA: hypothetical protein VFI82_07375 [Terriglobales bacterium]|jgi:hypothetical protein|nr:hypothetical protein [Terriglobales bacterium]